LDGLRQAIVECYENKLTPWRINISYEYAKIIPQIRKHGVIAKTDYEEKFIRLHLRLPPGGKEKVNAILKLAKKQQ
jgi:50S ribosomal subunit-associated GTPase HflX